LLESRFNHLLVVLLDFPLVLSEFLQVHAPVLFDKLIEVKMGILTLASTNNRISRVILFLDIKQLKRFGIIRWEAEQHFMPGDLLGLCLVPLILGAVITGINGVHISIRGELVERAVFLQGLMGTEFELHPFFKVLILVLL